MTESVVKQTGLLQSDVELLLQYCKYDVGLLMKEYSHFTDELCRKAGILLDKVGTNTEKELDLCTICYCDNIPGDETVTLGCKHWFCVDCFKAHLKNTIANGFTAICSATCPDQKCNIRIGRGKQICMVPPNFSPRPLHKYGQ